MSSVFRIPVIRVHYDRAAKKFVARTDLLPESSTIGDTPEKAISSLKVLIKMWKKGAYDRSSAKVEYS